MALFDDAEEALRGSEKSRNFSVRLPISLIERIEGISKVRGVSPARVIRYCLEQGVPQLETQLGIKPKTK